MSLLLAMLAQGAAAAEPAAVQLPREFWGEYNSVLADCGTSRNDTRLRISEGTLRFYESGGEVEQILTQPDGSIVLFALLSGEGETWWSLSQFRLSPDGQVLTITNPQTREMAQSGTDRFRCPDRSAGTN